ncbi:MAG: ion channel [Myxococcales bacterium]|nr:ion channel [Polyangiaceae bacterium]MDW8250870.1 ion channel [Myxococcales bacterium]
MTRTTQRPRQFQMPREIDPRMPHSWEIMIVILAVVSLVIFLVEWALEHVPRWLGLFDIGISLIFLVDFLIRFGRSPHRWLFFKSSWIDLLGAIPIVEPFNTFRVVRFLRLVRLWRIGRLLRRNREVFFPETLGKLGQGTLLAWTGAALSFFWFEHGKNSNIKNLSDALWWSLTTLSTVGYGDISPVTSGGRLVGMATMVLGVGLLGALAATMATILLDVRDLGRKGLRSYKMQDHLLILNWSSRAAAALDDFFHDPRYVSMKAIVVAELERSPSEDPRVFFVRGNPGRRETLDRASASKAALAMVFPAVAGDSKSDLQTALTVLMLRKINPGARIAAELVSSENHDYLTEVGCDAVVDVSAFGSMLLVRCLQDLGTLEVVKDLLTNKGGSELYRIPVPNRFLGKSFREYAHHMLDENCSVIGLDREHFRELNPDGSMILVEGDHALVVAREPPR